MRNHRSIWYALLVLAGWLSAMPVFGAFSFPATGTPAAFNVALTGPQTITVTWSVSITPSTTVPDVISSSVARITDPGQDVIYAVINRPLSRTIAVAGGTALITETVQIPRSAIQAGYRDGFTSLLYLREFTDSSDSDLIIPTVTLNITGTSGGDFGIGRLALHFDDRSVARLVQQGDTLRAQAELLFTGGGLLRATWEIADPASTFGEPLFRPLRSLRQPLTGGREVTLDSPPLPTERVGMHLLRLSVHEPPTAFEPVVIRYLVMQPGTRLTPPAELPLQSPARGVAIDRQTQFSWQGLPDARAYRIELFRQPPATPEALLPDLGTVDGTAAAPQPAAPADTGMLVLAESPQVQLSPLVWEKLVAGQKYWWRVQAIDAEGAIIGQSPYWEVRVP